MIINCKWSLKQGYNANFCFILQTDRLSWLSILRIDFNYVIESTATFALKTNVDKTGTDTTSGDGGAS